MAGLINLLAQAWWQLLQIAKKTNPHLFPLKCLQFPCQHPFKQGHQEGDFLPWTGPVLRREGVGGEGANAPITAEPQGAFEGFHPGPVAHDPGQATLAGPAAIAIHDQGDVGRQPLGIQAGG